MSKPSKRLLLAAATLAAVAAGAVTVANLRGGTAQADGPAGQPPPSTPVSVAVVESRDVAIWDEFSGRLEAVERVEVRSRVAGAVQAVHFREGALVKPGELLISIDPAPYAAEVARAEAQVAAARARLALARSESERGRQLWDSRAVSQRDIDQRLNAEREADANLRAAEAALQVARLNLGYTEIRAPVAGRVGKLEITVGNLVSAGPGAPVLTTLVSVDPIYAGFSADEQVVMRALRALGSANGARGRIEEIPVEMATAADLRVTGRMQLIDNQVDARSGTVRARAVFANPEGLLMPGQFVRLRMGQPKPEPALLVSERAVGTDQNKKFVLVVDAENKAVYRAVDLGPVAEGLRVVTSGLAPGERIVVNGLQRVRPGAVVAPELVPMAANPGVQAQNQPK